MGEAGSAVIYNGPPLVNVLIIVTIIITCIRCYFLLLLFLMFSLGNISQLRLAIAGTEMVYFMH